MACSGMSLGKTCRYYKPHQQPKFVMEICAFSDDNNYLQWRGGRGGGGGREAGARSPSDKLLGGLKSKGGAKIRNCQCEISYKICKVQLVNKFKVVVILAFLLFFNEAIVLGMSPLLPFSGAQKTNMSVSC